MGRASAIISCLDSLLSSPDEQLYSGNISIPDFIGMCNKSLNSSNAVAIGRTAYR